jgi:hypothetical protein
VRTLLGISVAAVIAAFVWSNLPTQAKHYTQDPWTPLQPTAAYEPLPYQVQ